MLTMASPPFPQAAEDRFLLYSSIFFPSALQSSKMFISTPSLSTCPTQGHIPGRPDTKFWPDIS